MTAPQFFPAGIGPAGFAPARNPGPPTDRIPPRAVNYDPISRDYTTTANLYDAIHPVDQATVIALTVERGSIKSAPEIGIPFSTIQRAGGQTLETQCRDCVNIALADLLSAKKIELVRVDVEAVVRGQVKIAVTYKNLVSKRIGTVQTG